MSENTAKTDAKKNKGGRPKGTYKIQMDEEKLNQIKVMAGLGLTRKQTSAILGISDDTFTEYSKTNPEVLSAIEMGRAEAAANVMRAAYNQAISEKSPAMTQFWLRAREGWDANNRPLDSSLDPTANVTPEKVDSTMLTDDSAPTYIVEMNKNGKFERAQPRQIAGSKASE